MNVNSLGGPHHPHHLRANHLYSRGDATPVQPAPAGEVERVPDSEEPDGQAVTPETMEAVRGRRAERMAQRDAQFSDRLIHMADHRVAKIGEKLERIAAHHGIEAGEFAELESKFSDAVGGLADQLAAEGFQPGAVADFRHAVHEALAELRSGVRGIIAGLDATPTADTDDVAPDGDVTTADAVDSAGAPDVAPDATSSVAVSTDPVAETTDAATPDVTNTSPTAERASEVDRVAVDLSDSALGLDVLTDTVRIADAFSLDDLGPSIDIRA
jgi:hypothetical protein